MDDKKSDFSDLTKKFNLNSVVNSLKALVSAEGMTPEVAPDDAIGNQIKQLSEKVQGMTKVQAEQTNALVETNKLLNELFASLQALRGMQSQAKDKAKGGVVNKQPQKKD